MRLWPATLAGIGIGALLLSNRQETHIMPQGKTLEQHLASLRTPVADAARSLMALALEAGVKLDIVQSFRSPADQAVIYAQGRTTPGPIVTHAKPGTSYHEYGLAFDVAVDKGGKPTWPNDIALWTKLGVLGESIGLKWGGRFPSPDYGHFELHMPGIGPGQSPAPSTPVA